MFEAHVLHLLRRYLGEYVHGLSSEALRISVWKGDVVLKDLKLKAEALNSLQLPVTVKAGFVGTITLKVPWKGLGKEPVIVLIDRVFILAHPASDGTSLSPEEREKIFEAKIQQIEEAESATLDAISKSKLGNSPAGNSWLGSLIGTIIGNLKISIGNVHIRYEDSVSNPGHPFAVGITLAKLAAFTVDEQGKETFDTSGALDKLRKSLQLERLAMYHDSNRPPWNMDKKWEDLSPKDWVEVFEDGINEPAKGLEISSWARDRNYLVSPINGVLNYHRLGNLERTDSEMPFEEAHLILGDVSLTLTEAQYHDWIRLLEVISRYKVYVEVSHLRPGVSVTKDPKLWWNYAAQASLQQKKMCYRLSWAQIQHFSRLRRRYIQLYAGSLQGLSDSSESEIRSIERDLDPKVILLWRFLAHAKVESVKSREEAEQRMLKKNSWFSFGWRSAETDTSEQDAPEESQTDVSRLSKEEWQAINNLLSFQPDEDLTAQTGKDMQNMTQRMVIVSIGQAAARIININECEIVCGRFEQLQVSAKFKHRSIYCDMILKLYGLSAPEGSLCQSVISQQKVNALAACFVYSPVGENLDWRLSATISPCHVTVLMESYNRFLEFMKRSNSVSPTVAFETAKSQAATALQNKLERATRRAQEQFQTVLEEQSRFALDIDLDAPKIRIPIRTSASSEYESDFLLDFGNFTLRTQEEHHDNQEQNLYSRFCITGRDIAAFFADGSSDIQTRDVESSCQLSARHSYSLVDRCGIVVIVDQIKVPHPCHPSTRVSVQVPTLGIHLSPSRFSLLMELLKILSGTIESGTKLVEDYQAEHAPWSSPDLATEVQILVWRGIGYSVASWQPSYIVLSGLYLYLLESQASQNYQRCTSMAGKQVYDVPSDNVGGSSSCIAVCIRGMDIQKALESSSTLVVKFRDEKEKASWLRGLVQATYRASATPSVDILGKQGDDVPELAEARFSNTKIADVIVNGSLVETKLFIYGKVGTEVHDEVVEVQVLEVLAVGGKVYVASCDGDLTVRMNLHLLKMKDELQNSSTGPHYLACSVVENYHASDQASVVNPVVEEVLASLVEEDDDFTDALTDFMSLPDSVEALAHDREPVKARGNSGDIFYEAEGTDDSDFVSLTFLKRTPESPDYDGIDTQMSIRMSKLECFCHRPTIVALISLGIDMGNASSGTSTSKKEHEDETLVQKDKGEELLKAKVKGLLGHGKVRVVFSLNMNVDSVTVFLNKEDGFQLAMLVQENFGLDLKVHPGSISVEGTLGNFRLCDVALGPDHCWGWFCDIRNQGADSLIQFAFKSYSPEDDDYEGYNYSLSGKLSAVRVVFLNRFIQELSAYFVALAAPNTEEAIKFVDKVGGFEWLIHKYEMEGSAALKLDLSMETPIIVVPRNSSSKDFLQLDLGRLWVTNEVSWHGPEDDPSAVHLDILHAQVLGINMAVGVDGVLGKPMIRQGREIHIFVRRSLRDIFRKVPNFALEVKIGSLHAVVSDKEYSVISSCVISNLSEEPNLPPNFRDTSSGSTDTIRMLADKVNMTSQVFLSRSVNIMSVQLDYALLELCNGVQEDSPLANITLEGMWFSYRMTSFSEMDLYVTIPRFSILDARPDTRPEMRLMLGTSTDVLKQASNNKGGLLPRVLVVPDFLLTVGEFFVPSLGAITGKEEVMDPQNDPISNSDTIVLSGAFYKQTEDEVNLSPNRQLVVDAAGVDEFTYDGCGKILILNEDHEQSQASEFRPIIVIGRGKRLRFVNVKIKNALLLTDYTYLSSDSSFSVSSEDGVEVVMQDNSSLVSEKKSLDKAEKALYSSTISDADQTETSKPSLSFEAQVVSPEFTFYDSSRSSIDGSFQAEKLLRARMDLSFMFASKENDTWIRALLKDLTVEAGSGLRILDPVDISGGYTSVKDKTNISLISSDIFVHLSLSAISLILNLQSQAISALRFQSADPLSPCTNYDQVWVSPKAKGHHDAITFWRPRAPSNYVILGDCVTSRPIPPSQAVMAVSNTYGRVRKPLGFELVGSFSGIQQSERVEDDCSLWKPIAPPGYLAVGCVAHIGNQPPPNHIVYCIRADLATSTAYSACMFSASSNKSYPSGFSIWRLDNVLGSFYANPSISSPSQDICLDLNHLLLMKSSWHRLSARESRSDVAIQHNQQNQGTNSSGWDVLRSISKANCYMSTPSFERIWWDKGSDTRRPVSIWRPIPRPGFKVLGDCITEGLEPPALGIIFKADNPDISANPVQFTKVANIIIKGLDEAFFWYPIAPPGYASMGCIVTRVDEMPKLNMVSCPRSDLVNQANIPEMPISKFSSSKPSQCWSIWKVDNQACTFLARSDLKKPSSRLGFTIGDSVKPKTRDNIMAEIKLKCFSVTILDSLCGMMTPFFDVTITNIKLATHGGIDSMNAVLISSIAASTFNTQLDSWEPLVEPFDGIFKFETYDTTEQSQSTIGKRARIAATSILNINISAASIDTLAETMVSWRRLKELEQKAIKLDEESNSHSIGEDGSVFSALDVDDFQTVNIENRLGCDIYLKKYDQSSRTVNLLQCDDGASVWIPPSRYSDRLNSVDDSREGRCYVAVQIVEAKDLPTVNDGNSNSFFCALRLVVESQEASQQRLFPQSARTRCVKPVFSKNSDLGSARWNELFIFEVPRKGLARLEVEVTNLSAKAGKGEVVGASTISVGHGANPLRKVASARMLQQATDGQKNATHLLMRRGQHTNDELPFQGCLVASTSYYEMKAISNLQSTVEEKDSDNDVGFWVGLDPEGVWESFRSFLPLSVIARKMVDDFIAMEVVMKDGKKHAILRGLATVANDTNVKLDINVSSVSVGMNQNVDNNKATEEIFENQRHVAFFGWGKRPSFRGNEPGRWSNRNLSYSTSDFYEPPLPPGWTWTSAWEVDKSESVDVDGWAYGRDYQTLTWPPTPQNASKSAQDSVRRRRWIRKREIITDQQTPNAGSDIRLLEPGSSYVLPWRSMSKDSDSCLHIRPSAENNDGVYTWGCPVGLVSAGVGTLSDQGQQSKENSVKQGKKLLSSSFKLNHLEKNDSLWCCPTSDGKQFWLSIGADASVLQSELNSPVYDWKISVNAPLKLENRLPCPAQFTIWEKLSNENTSERQRGLILSRGIVPIYHADVRNPLFLSLSLQGGWKLEKDPVPILDITSNNHASSFWMIHQSKRRRLRVSIERDMGASAASPNTIRFFVPYWISNDCSIPLTYRVVEIEPLENADADSLLNSKAFKSGKLSFKNPSNVTEAGSRKNIQILEAIDDTSPTPSMLSPQDYVGHGGANLFSSRNDAYLSPRVGISVAIQHSDKFSPGLSLLELEKKQRVDVKAFSSDGSYHNLSALLHMTSDRTKVVHFQPHTLFYNRAGINICMQQCDTKFLAWIHPTDAPNHFKWQTSAKVELLKVKTDGYHWSTPFSVASEGWMRVSLRNETTGKYLYLKVEVRSGTTGSRFDVIFRPNTFSSQYRIENHSMFLPFHYRQVDGSDDSWRCLHPCTSASFSWEDIGRQRMLEVMVDGSDTKESAKYNIDEVRDYQPVQVDGGPTKAVRVTILKEEKTNVVMLRDWMPDNNSSNTSCATNTLSTRHNNINDVQPSVSTSDCEFHLTLELTELGVSIIDHTPEEILYMSVQNLLLSHSTGLGSGISRIKLRMRGIQVDNQLPLSPMPVLFRPQRMGIEADYILKFSMTQQSDGSLDFRAYPYIGLQGPENSAFLISIHEPIIWRLHGMVQQIDVSRFSDAQKTAVSVDPIIEIGVLNISEFRFKFSMAMSPTQRPVGVLGFWSSLMTALGNTENMPVRVNHRFLENLSMRESVLTTNAISNITKDLLSQPLQLLSGVDILGNASSAFGHMSKGVAALSMDKKFIQSRQRQENKGVEDFGDVIREGGGALAKGLFRGVTGILTKPLEGAKASGVEGFVQGVGKGIIGAAAQPVSGVLDLLSKTTEGANAMRMKIAAAITSEDLLLRRRLPRVISGDNLLKPYDDYRAQGQAILQLAESGSFFLQVDLFKVRGKFALSDAYEDHFSLRKDKILLVTHRRVILLQTSNIITQKKFNPARDPCLVLWDVLWEDLATMELTTGKKDHNSAPPSKLLLYLKSKTSENNDQTRVIKCYRDTKQAIEVYNSINQAMATYSPKDAKDMHKRKVKRPYSATADVSTAEAVFLKERPWSSQQVPAPLPPNSSFGSQQ
nr:vacuolar protein sorting-associated protein 62 [Tanacetum cinerariifolium]